MFFDIQLLCRQGRGDFAVCWIAATRGVRYIKSNQILEVDVVHLCDQIQAMILSKSNVPNARLSLSLAAKLINGTIKINFKKAVLLQGSIVEFICCVGKPIVEVTPSPIVAVKKKRTKKVQVAAPIVAEEAVQLPHLTIDDVETALRQVPTGDEYLITLRDEVIPRTLPRDDEGGFGDFGDFRNLDLHMPIDIIGEILPEQLVPQFEEFSAVPLPQLQSKELGKEVESAGKPIKATKRRLSPEREIYEPLEKRQKITAEPAVEPRKHVQEAVPVAVLEEAIPVEVHEAIQPEVVELPRPVEVVVAQPPETVEVVQAGVLTPAMKKAPKAKGIFVRDIAPKVRILLRCSELDDETSDLDAFKNTYTLSIKTADFENINQMSDYFSMVGPFLPISSADAYMEFMLEARASGSLSSFASSMANLSKRKTSRLQGVSIQSGRVTSTLRRTDISELQPPLETPTTINITECRPRPIEEPNVPQIEEPQLEHVEVPIEQSTRIQQEILPERTFEEVIPPAAFINRQPERGVIDVSPSASTKRMNIMNRQRAIIKIVKNWNYDAGELTIEDVCMKPLNRLNLAAAFGDLLALIKQKYVILTNKPGSIELRSIEKGEKLQKKH